MDWLSDNWKFILIGIYVIEKIVHISPAKWDDIIFDGLKAIVIKLHNAFGRP